MGAPVPEDVDPRDLNSLNMESDEVVEGDPVVPKGHLSAFPFDKISLSSLLGDYFSFLIHK